MNEVKLKAKQGGNMRAYFTFFEIEALKYAFENNLQAGESFTFGKTSTPFLVKVNNEYEIVINRNDIGKIIEANKVSKTASPQKESEPEKTDSKPQETEVINETITEKSENKMENTQENNIKQLSEMFAKTLAGLNQNNAEPVVDYQRISEMIDNKIEASKSFTVKVNDAPEVKIEGTPHAKFEETLFWCANRMPVYLYGPAGTGKNVLSQQIAEALNLNFYYAGCLQFKSDLEGFVNAAGEYVETDFYKAFTQGGVFLLDGIDGTAAEVLVAFGAALANRYYNFPKYGRIQAHPDFVVIAAGNTAGRGATEACNGRYQLDASALDRFAFVQLDYDITIELKVAGGDADLVEFAHDLRNAIKNCGLTYTVSTRAIKRISMGMKFDKIDKKNLFNSALCSGWAPEDISMLKPLVNANNKYAKIFKTL